MIDNCQEKFHSPFLYFDHLQTLHKVPRFYRFKCTSIGCHQIVANWYVFKRHLLGHQDGHESNTPYSASTTKTITSNVSNNIIEESRNQYVIQSEEQKPDQVTRSPYDVDRGEIYRTAVEITLELHNETNLSRSDARSVQQKSSLLTSKIADKIEQLIPFDSIQPDIAFNLKELLDRLRSPFDFIDSDFKFFKQIEQMQIFRPPIVINIENNNEIEIQENSRLKEKKTV